VELQVIRRISPEAPRRCVELQARWDRARPGSEDTNDPGGSGYASRFGTWAASWATEHGWPGVWLTPVLQIDDTDHILYAAGDWQRSFDDPGRTLEAVGNSRPSSRKARQAASIHPREVRPPVLARPEGQSGKTASPQQRVHTVDGLLGRLVHTGRDHHQDPPLAVIDRLASCQVLLPLLDALDVVATVVLDDHPHPGPAQVVAAKHLAVDRPDLKVDLGLGNARQHQQHPQPRLHRRVDLLPDVRRSAACEDAGPTRRAAGRLDQGLGAHALSADHPVACHHELDQRQHRGKLHEQIRQGRDPDSSHHRDLGGLPHVAGDSRSSEPVAHLGHCHVLAGRQLHRHAPDPRGRRVTGEGAGEEAEQRRLGSQLRGVRHVGGDEDAVQDATKAWAVQGCAAQSGRDPAPPQERSSRVELALDLHPCQRAAPVAVVHPVIHRRAGHGLG
jgi:hypothetical protein